MKKILVADRLPSHLGTSVRNTMMTSTSAALLLFILLPHVVLLVEALPVIEEDTNNDTRPYKDDFDDLELLEKIEDIEEIEHIAGNFGEEEKMECIESFKEFNPEYTLEKEDIGLLLEICREDDNNDIAMRVKKTARKERKKRRKHSKGGRRRKKCGRKYMVRKMTLDENMVEDERKYSVLENNERGQMKARILRKGRGRCGRKRGQVPGRLLKSGEGMEERRMRRRLQKEGEEGVEEKRMRRRLKELRRSRQMFFEQEQFTRWKRRQSMAQLLQQPVAQVRELPNDN